MNDITVTDEYGYDKDYSFLDEVFSHTLKDQKVENAIFSVIFVDENTICNINKEYRGIDKVTDVISFAFEDNNDLVYNNMRVLGDIYICIPKMISQAKEYGHTEKRELAFLACHGLLHLLGYDHVNNKEEEKIMFDLQERLLNEVCITR